MSEAKRVLRAIPGTLPHTAHESVTDAPPERSGTVIAFGLVAVVSMLFGFAIGLLF